MPVLDILLFIFEKANKIFVALQLRYVLTLSHGHNKADLLHFPSYVYVSVILQCSWREYEQNYSSQELWNALFYAEHSTNACLGYVQVDIPVS